MLTHVNPFVAVCEEKSGQLWPPNGPKGSFSAQIWWVTALWAPILRPVEVLRGFDTLRGYFEILIYVGDPLLCEDYGAGASTIGGTVYMEAHRRERGQCTHKEALQALHYGGLYRAPPLKNTILGSYRAVRLPSRRISEKSAVPPLRRMVQRGGGENSPLFFENRRQGGLTAR